VLPAWERAEKSSNGSALAREAVSLRQAIVSDSS
jgi:hypothetical protein